MTTLESAKAEEVFVPTKVVEEIIDISMSCNVLFVDFEGRADGRSVKNIIPQLQARKIVSPKCFFLSSL